MPGLCRLRSFFVQTTNVMFDAPIQFDVHQLAVMIYPTTIMIIAGAYIAFFTGKIVIISLA